MSEIIKMDYPSMEEMAKVFRKSSQELDEIRQRMLKMVSELEGGVLIGDAGDAFATGIRETFCPVLQRLSEKLKELDTDIYGALIDLRDGDTTAQSRFK